MAPPRKTFNFSMRTVAAHADPVPDRGGVGDV